MSQSKLFLLTWTEVELDKNRLWCPNRNCETICTVGPADKPSSSQLPSPSTSLLLLPRSVLCPTCALEFCSSCKKPVSRGHVLILLPKTFARMPAPIKLQDKAMTEKFLYFPVASIHDLRRKLEKKWRNARFNAALRQRSDKMLSHVRGTNRERRRLCSNDVQTLQARLLLVLFGEFRRELRGFI